ncbi:NAD(P)-binding protein [Dothidotthia symphoricarpi CBS 119687]|uniref:NAD(P)-binding protein n=1 Tax=Dothidotthia symphoricarpi CBS 119687 TaxID=1392245 RepID=A0A6A6ATY2_9PLEO|nr:NAD(P)-binding protein [Dothidotthia symphoricarpi CBS 119687]KAF2134297.1 NAD(P)-binding protein [Dothidotthia symphoricarpi CBS 119687]
MNGISTLNLNKIIRPGLERAPTSMNLARPLPIHRLEGKVALIIGGGGKIGIETAGRLLVEGANVALVDIDQASLEGAVPVLKAAIPTGVPLESRLLTIAADATIEADVEACVKKTIQRFGKLDCALLNAGERDASKSLFDTTEEDYERIMSTNVKSAFLGVKHTAAAMRDGNAGGSIILRSSIAGLRGFPGMISYSTSRFALRGIALTAAEELGQFGIRVNTIHTSIIATPGFKEGWSKENLAELKEDTALGRFGQPDDVASVVAFLASEDSKFMTGGHLKIDGGCVSV